MKRLATTVLAALVASMATSHAAEWTGIRDAQIGMSVSTEELERWDRDRAALAPKLGVSEIRYLTLDGRLVAIEMLTENEAQTRNFAKAIVASWGQPSARYANGKVTRWIGAGHTLTLRLEENGAANIRLEQVAEPGVSDVTSSTLSDVEDWASELLEHDLARDQIDWEEQLAADQARAIEQEELVERAARQAADEAAERVRNEGMWYYPCLGCFPPVIGQPYPPPAPMPPTGPGGPPWPQPPIAPRPGRPS